MRTISEIHEDFNKLKHECIDNIVELLKDANITELQMDDYISIPYFYDSTGWEEARIIRIERDGAYLTLFDCYDYELKKRNIANDEWLWILENVIEQLESNK